MTIEKPAHAALEKAEAIVRGEQAQLCLAAELMGVEYGDFIDRLMAEANENH